MIKHWEEICTQIEATEEKLQEFIEGAGLSSLQAKKLEKFTREWNKTKKLAELFDQFVTPVDPIKVKSPFNREDFRYIWKMWKEYLSEQHGILMRSRMEQASLDYLNEISEGNADKAIDYIRFAMTGPYRKFFKVENSSSINAKQVQELQEANSF